MKATSDAGLSGTETVLVFCQETGRIDGTSCHYFPNWKCETTFSSFPNFRLLKALLFFLFQIEEMEALLFILFQIG